MELWGFVGGTIIRWHLGYGHACLARAEVAAGIEEWDCENSLWSEQEMWENLTNKQDMEQSNSSMLKKYSFVHFVTIFFRST